MSIRLRISLLMFVLFIVAVTNSILTFRLERVGEDKLGWVNHTHEVIFSTEKLLTGITDAETGQRGYLLTGDATYLEPYHNGLVLAEEAFIKLKNLTSDNPEQADLLLKIDEDMRHKFDELAKTISLVQGGQKSAALEIVSLNKGKQFMDAIRDYISIFAGNEMVLLEKRKGGVRENRAAITTLIFVGTALFVGLSVVTFLFLNKSLFSPLNMLLRSVERVEQGQRLVAADIVYKDEMGRLLSAFYEMGYKVYEREKTLEHKANHDNLTGLKNRSTVLEEIEQSVSKSIEANSRTAILFMDLDSFKQINDSLGHDIGDLVLKEAALRLSASVRSSDTIFRMGGDEFLIILKNVKDIDDVFSVIQKIQNEFSASVQIKGKTIDMSISIGISISPDDSINSSQLMEFSDIAMYAAKKEQNAVYKLFEKSMLKRACDRPVQGVVNT